MQCSWELLVGVQCGLTRWGRPQRLGSGGSHHTWRNRVDGWPYRGPLDGAMLLWMRPQVEQNSGGSHHIFANSDARLSGTYLRLDLDADQGERGQRRCAGRGPCNAAVVRVATCADDEQASVDALPF